MDARPYDRDIARLSTYAHLHVHWSTTALLGPIASRRLRRAVRRARASGAVVRHARVRVGVLTRYHRVDCYGEGAQLLALPTMLARLLAGRFAAARPAA
ncbi:hypothetical protein [Nonomuraea sp. NPDC023979]|uniref:hypothetical protein n=1 Tax=Nonomuraea sp. NPDC023979 TaxID=3154796 RepID=UPI0033D24C8F